MDEGESTQAQGTRFSCFGTQSHREVPVPEPQLGIDATPVSQITYSSNYSLNSRYNSLTHKVYLQFSGNYPLISMYNCKTHEAVETWGYRQSLPKVADSRSPAAARSRSRSQVWGLGFRERV